VRPLAISTAIAIAAIAAITAMAASCTLIDTSEFSGGIRPDGSVEDGSASGDGGGPSPLDGSTSSDANPIGNDAASSKYSATILATPGLIGYWRFGDKSATAVSAIPGGGTGLLSGTVEIGAPGLIANDPDTAFGFPINDQVTFGNSLYGFEGTAPFSVEFWHSPTSLSGFQSLVGKHANPVKEGWLLSLDSSGYALYREGSGTGDGIETGFIPAIGSINHVVATYNGTTYRLYVNNVQPIPAGTLGATPLPATDKPLRVGFEVRGRIDEVAIYDREIDADQVSTHYKAGRE
jgi:hypothetical protein